MLDLLRTVKLGHFVSTLVLALLSLLLSGDALNVLLFHSHSVRVDPSTAAGSYDEITFPNDKTFADQFDQWQKFSYFSPTPLLHFVSQQSVSVDGITSRGADVRCFDLTEPGAV